MFCNSVLYILVTPSPTYGLLKHIVKVWTCTCLFNKKTFFLHLLSSVVISCQHWSPFDLQCCNMCIAHMVVNAHIHMIMNIRMIIDRHINIRIVIVEINTKNI